MAIVVKIIDSGLACVMAGIPLQFFSLFDNGGTAYRQTDIHLLHVQTDRTKSILLYRILMFLKLSPLLSGKDILKDGFKNEKWRWICWGNKRWSICIGPSKCHFSKYFCYNVFLLFSIFFFQRLLLFLSKSTTNKNASLGHPGYELDGNLKLFEELYNV